MRQLIFASLFVVLAAQPLMAADIKAGEAALEMHEYDAALAEFRPLAEQGVAEAQFRLGYLYRNGYGIIRDHKLAALWYGRAAEQGHLRAQTSIAVAYELGRGVARDLSKALSWYQKAAGHHHAPAQEYLGDFLARKGNGLRNPAQAYFWYGLAFTHPDACGCLLDKRSKLVGEIGAAKAAEMDRKMKEWLESR